MTVRPMSQTKNPAVRDTFEVRVKGACSERAGDDSLSSVTGDAVKTSIDAPFSTSY
jgi:hypothetical protein